MHETQTKRHAVRMAKTTSHCSLAKRLELPGRRPIAGLLIKLGRTMAPHLRTTRNGGFEVEANSWSSSKNNPTPKKKIIAIFAQGCIGSRLSNGALDAKAYCKGHRAPFRDSVSYEPCLAFDAGMELELPEACQESPGKGRTTNSGLEGSCLAPYKKKPKSLGHTWFSSMNPAFFFPRMSGKRGRPKEKHQFFRWRPIRKNCPLFLQSAFRPKEDGLPSLSAFILTKTFMEMRSRASSSTCCTESEAPFSCSGIKVKSMLKPRWLKSSCKNIIASIQTFSPLAHQSLIPMNMFGAISRGTWRTAFQKILNISKNFCNRRPINFDIHESFCRLALQLPSYHGNS